MNKRRVLLITVAALAAGWAAIAFARNLPKPPLSDPEAAYPVVLLGDSLAAGVGASDDQHGFASQFLEKTAARYPKARLDNLGVSGATVADVLVSQADNPSLARAKLVVVIVGTNDIIRGTGDADFAKEYDQLARKLASPDRQLLMFNVPRFSQTPVIPQSLRKLADFHAKSFNASIAETARDLPNATVLDFYALSETMLASDAGLISADGFHPNDRGYALMAEQPLPLSANALSGLAKPATVQRYARPPKAHRTHR